MKKRKIGLSIQINLIFTIVILLTSILFIFLYEKTINNFAEIQGEKHFKLYHERLNQAIIAAKDPYPIDPNYAYGYFKVNEKNEFEEIINYDYKNFINHDEIQKILKNDLLVEEQNSKEKKHEKFSYYTHYYKNQNDETYLLITLSNGDYIESLKAPINNIIIFGFIAIIVLGNAIILLWTSITVLRIKRLEKEVGLLSKTDYKNEITVKGIDEIAELSLAIDQMRKEILKNELIKQEILQNISHDIKTPIAVIQSYAEAIKDKIADISYLDVILIQVDVLNKKVRQLLKWNELKYLHDNKKYYDVYLKEVIQTVVSNYKYQSSKKFVVKLDDSKFLGLTEDYYSVINNIIENAIRYANKTIKITLKDNKLTISNDGPLIDDKFINKKFKPYEKGHNGQFGLGMSIVEKIVSNFNLRLLVEKDEKWTHFIIQPNEDI